MLTDIVETHQIEMVPEGAAVRTEEGMQPIDIESPVSMNMWLSLIHILCMEKKIVVKEKPEGKRVYASHFYYLELNTAKMLYDLDIKNEVGEDYLEKRLSKIEAYAELSLDELQRTAVKEAVKKDVYKRQAIRKRQCRC